MGKFRDLTGQVFGRLTVISKTDLRKNHSVVWKCVCSCKNTNIVNITSNSLVRGDTKSCGCITKENAAKLGKITHTYANKASKKYLGAPTQINTMYRNYKNSDMKKGREFNLTRDQFYKLTQGNCYYCGSAPSLYIWNSKYFGNKPFYKNGIDRVDSNIGHIPENCVSCCVICNRAKNNMTTEDFLSWVDKLINFRKLHNE